MKVNVYLYDQKEEFEFKKAEKIDQDRWIAIHNYMFMEAGVKPVNGISAYIINENEWLSENPSGFSGFVSKAKITENGGSSFKNHAILIKRGKNSRYFVINRRLIHEAFGHMGYEDEHNITKLDENSYRISEVFSRILDSFLMVGCSLLDKMHLGDESEKFYAPGTDVLESRAFAIYKQVGKKAIVQLFYSAKPESLDNTLIDKVYKNRKLMKAIGLLSTRYGGSVIGSLLNNTDILLEKADNVRDEINKGTISEQDLKIRHIKDEFCLGESFASSYVKQLKKFSLDQIMNFKPTNDFDKVSELKWIYSHGSTTKPDYERGLRFLNHYFGKVKCVWDMEKLYAKTRNSMKV